MARNVVEIARSFGRGDIQMQLLRYGLSLYLTVAPNDIIMKKLQIRVFLHLNINLRDVSDNTFLSMIKNIFHIYIYSIWKVKSIEGFRDWLKT